MRHANRLRRSSNAEPNSKSTSSVDDTRWTRADKINAIIAVTALAVALAPIGHVIYNVLTAPSVTISNVRTFYNTQASECTTTFNASVRASNIPDDQSLWLVALGNNGLWFPAENIDTNFPQPWPVYAGTTTNASIYEYVVIMLSSSDDGTFVNYVNHPHDVDPGLSSLPPGYRFMTTWKWPGLGSCPPSE